MARLRTVFFVLCSLLIIGGCVTREVPGGLQTDTAVRIGNNGTFTSSLFVGLRMTVDKTLAYQFPVECPNDYDCFQDGRRVTFYRINASSSGFASPRLACMKYVDKQSPDQCVDEGGPTYEQPIWTRPTDPFS